MAKTRAMVPTTPAVMPDDERQASEDGLTLGSWLKGIAGFFLQARELEENALAVLAEAQVWKTPKTADEDVALQRFITQTTADRKEVEAHWSICSVVHRFHRKLTAKRDIAVKALEDANGIGNRLHNTYTAEERRKAEAEDRRRREEAEFLARQEREQELARAEAAALEAEAASPDLSERETRFVDLVWNGTTTPERAAQAAGYKDARQSALKLSGMPKILAAIKAKQQAAEIRRQAAVKAAEPVVAVFDEVQPAIKKAAGTSERTYESGEVVDVDAFREAYLSGRYGIPRDAMEPVQKVINALAKQMGPRLNTIPGLRYKSETKVQ